MNGPIHDDEPDVSAGVVRTLLRADCPQWATAPIAYLDTSGTANAMWRVTVDDGPDVVVRLPRRPRTASGVGPEIAVLQQLESSPLRHLVNTPTVRHIGQPHDRFPHPWAVLEWIDGTDAWAARRSLTPHRPSAHHLPNDLAQVVTAIGEITIDGARRRSPGERGGPLEPLLDRLDRWLTAPQWHADALLDVAAVRRAAGAARELVDDPVPVSFVHGDLIPGNVLLRAGRVAAIIDWGGAGTGDPAQDLAPAWSLLTAAERPAFQEAVAVDDAAWIRGRTFELEHAVGAVVYYTPRRHPLGAVMGRTLHQVLTAS